MKAIGSVRTKWRRRSAMALLRERLHGMHVEIASKLPLLLAHRRSQQIGRIHRIVRTVGGCFTVKVLLTKKARQKLGGAP